MTSTCTCSHQQVPGVPGAEHHGPAWIQRDRRARVCRTCHRPPSATRSSVDVKGVIGAYTPSGWPASDANAPRIVTRGVPIERCDLAPSAIRANEPIPANACSARWLRRLAPSAPLPRRGPITDNVPSSCCPQSKSQDSLPRWRVASTPSSISCRTSFAPGTLYVTCSTGVSWATTTTVEPSGIGSLPIRPVFIACLPGQSRLAGPIASKNTVN